MAEQRAPGVVRRQTTEDNRDSYAICGWSVWVLRALEGHCGFNKAVHELRVLSKSREWGQWFGEEQAEASRLTGRML